MVRVKRGATHWTWDKRDGLNQTRFPNLPSLGFSSLKTRLFSIRTRLFLVIASVFIPLFALAAVLAVNYADAQRKIVEIERVGVTDKLTYLLDREILGVRSVIHSLAASPELRNGDLAAFERHVEAAISVQRIYAVTLLDRSGNKLFTTLKDQAPVASVNAALIDLVFAGTTVVSDLIMEAPPHPPNFKIIAPVVRDGVVVYALCVSISPERLNDLFREAGLKPDWRSAIVDRQGRFLARSLNNNRMLGQFAQPALVNVARSNANGGFFENVTFEGVHVSNSFSRSPISGWTVVIAVPTQILNAPLRSTLIILGLSGAACIAFGLGVASLIAKRIATPIRALSKSAVALVHGQELPTVRHSINELHEVVRAFDYAATVTQRQKLIEQRVRESEVRFRSIFENAAVGVAQVALDGRWLMVNDRMCEIVGYSRERLLEMTFQDVTHREDLAQDVVSVEKVIEGAITTYTLDKRYVRLDGTLIWVELTASLTRDEAGAPQYFIAIVSDITARKNAEHHIHFLMNELSHRSKNLLSVIQSMAQQTARTASSMDDFQKRFGQRLQGLATSHDLLAHQDWQSVPIADLVRQQLHPFVDRSDTRIQIEGPSLNLTAEAAQAFGLALHELATNAIKYGALSTLSGSLTIQWSLLQKNGEPSGVCVNWIEHGGPPVTPPTHKGFGHVVMDRMLSAAVDGAVTLEFAPEGLNWRLDMPPSAVVLKSVTDQEADKAA